MVFFIFDGATQTSYVCFAGVMAGLSREGTWHPNLIQTHSSPEGIKGGWGLGEPFPKQRGSFLAFTILFLLINTLQMGTKKLELR